MYKVDIDQVSGRLRSYTEIQGNIPIYNDDVIVQSLTQIGDLIFRTKEGEEYEQELERLCKQLTELQAEDEREQLMRLIIDEGKSLEEAREQIRLHREQIAELQTVIKEKENAHEEAIREYYRKKDAEADAAIDFKHYTGVVLLIKDENRYLREWIDYHDAIGFDKIYIYDNGVKERVAEIVEAFPDAVREKITIIDWTGHHEHIQQDAYNHFLANFREEVRWALMIDSDEFLTFTDSKTTNVNDFLKDYEDYTEIWGYEVEYNANGQERYEDRPVRERFTETTTVRDGYFWKNFIQPNRISHFTMHYARYNDQKHFLYKNGRKNSDLFRIDHYYTKSWEEWKWKIKERGGADPNYHKILSEFFFYNPDMKYLDTGENVCQSYEGDLYD